MFTFPSARLPIGVVVTKEGKNVTVTARISTSAHVAISCGKPYSRSLPSAYASSIISRIFEVALWPRVDIFDVKRHGAIFYRGLRYGCGGPLVYPSEFFPNGPQNLINPYMMAEIMLSLRLRFDQACAAVQDCYVVDAGARTTTPRMIDRVWKIVEPYHRRFVAYALPLSVAASSREDCMRFLASTLEVVVSNDRECATFSGKTIAACLSGQPCQALVTWMCGPVPLLQPAPVVNTQGVAAKEPVESFFYTPGPWRTPKVKVSWLRDWRGKHPGFDLDDDAFSCYLAFLG